MPALSALMLRLACNQAARDEITEKRTNRLPIIWIGNKAVLQCALFIGSPASETLVDDFATITQANLVIRATNSAGLVQVNKTLPKAGFDNLALAWADWQSDAGQHFSFALEDTDTNQLAGRFWFAVEVITSDSGPITVATGAGEWKQDGIGDAGPPVAADYTAFSRLESDGRYLPSSFRALTQANASAITPGRWLVSEYVFYDTDLPDGDYTFWAVGSGYLEIDAVDYLYVSPSQLSGVRSTAGVLTTLYSTRHARTDAGNTFTGVQSTPGRVGQVPSSSELINTAQADARYYRNSFGLSIYNLRGSAVVVNGVNVPASALIAVGTVRAGNLVTATGATYAINSIYTPNQQISTAAVPVYQFYEGSVNNILVPLAPAGTTALLLQVT